MTTWASYSSLSLYTLYEMHNFSPPSPCRLDIALTNEGVRVAGRVGTGSMNWNPKDLHLQFMLSSFKEGEPVHAVPVRYQGILPDMFAEGRDVIVEGRYSHENILEAKTIMTSCPSKYEAEKPDERAQGPEAGNKKTVN